MPKDSDMFKAGTEKDATLSLEYCNYWYDNAVFMESDSICTAKDMQEFVKGTLKEQAIGKVKRWLYTIAIRKLKRWKK